MNTYIFNFFLVTWEMLCCKLLLEAFSKKKKYKCKLIPYVIFILLVLIEYSITYFLYEYLLLKIGAVLMILWLAMFFLFHGSAGKIIGLTMLYQGIGVACDYSIILLIGKLFPTILDDTMGQQWGANLIVIISKIILFFIILFIRKIGQQAEDTLTLCEWIELLIIPAITITCIILMISKFDILSQITQDEVLLYVALGMATMNIAVFLLMESIFKREKVICDNKVLAEKAKNEMKMYYSISENLDKQRKMTHEFKNHISCMGELIRKEEYSELKLYLQKITKEILPKTDIVDTNNVIINAVINTKYREAIEKGITFVLKANDLSCVRISDIDIVTILSNLLNNAIEACEQCENKIIKLKFVEENGQTIISVKNSIQNQIKKNGEDILTTKVYMAEEHGMGIKNVIDAIEKNGGKYYIDYDEKEFSFLVIL